MQRKTPECFDFYFESSSLAVQTVLQMQFSQGYPALGRVFKHICALIVLTIACNRWPHLGHEVILFSQEVALIRNLELSEQEVKLCCPASLLSSKNSHILRQFLSLV